jgi:tetratricopeptide (TPR) repeat protein
MLESPPIGRRAGAPAEPAAPLGLVGWDLRSGDTASQRRVALLQALAQAAPDDRAARRAELARHYLSRALAAEALGVLGRADGLEPEAARQARQALRGAAALLMGRIDAAAQALGAAAFNGDPEVALWRAAIAASRHDWPLAARELARSAEVLAAYPQALRLRLGLLAAATAIETGNAELAATVLAQLEGLQLAPDERARLAFLSGVASARRGALETADEIWRPLEHDGPIDVCIQAAFARTELLLEAGELEPADAVARLAATRTLWPGHPWEERMLGGLARIRADAGDRPGALRTWRELLERFPGTVDAPAIRMGMCEALIASLRSDGAAGFEPIAAYALFREFEPLIPHDGPGDRLRRDMAERLAALDLIRPAAAALEALLSGRGGVDKAAAGADLAELWLREPDPAAALAALERSRIETPLPAALDQRRRILQATALARLDRGAAALPLLDGLNAPAADQLRVALLWRQQDWPRLVAAIERSLARRSDPESPLTEDEQATVVQLGLAYGRLGQSAALAELRTRFGAALRGRPLEPAFLMATVASGAAIEPEAVLVEAEQHLQRVRGYLEAVRATN